jgi:hypothetical protein
MIRIVGGLGVLVLLQSAALAQTASAPSSCNNVARNICAPGAAGHLAAAQGAVLISRGVGFAEIEAGASLKAGDRIMVKNGTATLSLGGSCSVTLKKSSMATLINRDGSLCAAGLRPDPASVAQGGPVVREDRRVDPVPAIIVGAGLTTALAAILANRGNDRALERAPVFVSRPAVN